MPEPGVPAVGDFWGTGEWGESTGGEGWSYTETPGEDAGYNTSDSFQNCLRRPNRQRPMNQRKF